MNLTYEWAYIVRDMDGREVSRHEWQDDALRAGEAVPGGAAISTLSRRCDRMVWSETVCWTV